jgi:hypothetical protein
MAMKIYQLKRRLSAHDVELLKSQAKATGPHHETRRFLFFVRYQRVYVLPDDKEDRDLSFAEIDAICRTLGLSPYDI